MGMVPKPSTMLSSPKVPSPRRLSGEFGCGLPVLPAAHVDVPTDPQKGSACVAGSSSFAMRVWMTPVSMDSNQRGSSLHHWLQPSPTKTKSKAPPVDIPFDAYDATLTQSTSVPF